MATDIVLQQKVQSWTGYVPKLHTGEQSLQLLASQSNATLSQFPLKIEEVPTAEEKLKAAKKVQKDLGAQRIELVSPITKMLDRLMEPEKSMTEPIALYERSIIDLKAAERDRLAKIQLKENEAKAIEQHVSNKIANYTATANTYIETTVQKAFEHALGEGKISFEGMSKYLETVISARGTVEVFQKMMDASSYEPKYHTFEEKAAIVEKIAVPDFSTFVENFKITLVAKFQNYDLALKNADIAIARAQTEAAEQKAAIEAQKVQAEAINAINANAETMQVSSGVKQLKQAYEVDMVENEMNAFKILAAFQANIALCRPKTTTKKWFGFSADSAAKALAKVKCEDNSFAPAGITFKVVDKL